MMRVDARWFALILLPAAIAGCKRSSPPEVAAPVAKGPTCAVPVKAVVEPSTVQLAADDPGVQLVARMTSATNGTTRDLTTSAEWKVEPAGIASVDASGYVKGIKPGKATVSAGPSSRPSVVEVVAAPEAGRPWRFADDIEPILTRTGCNAGGCHGRQAGQNGFHLSLYGYDAEADFAAITRDLGGRRVNRMAPDSSLLIAKATGKVPHGGGRALDPASDDCATLARWIAAGHPLAGPGNHGAVDRIAVEPARARLDGPGDEQLRVVAHFADGHERDVTRLATFRTLDDATATVDARGLARLVRRGETDIVVRFGSKVASARIASVMNPELSHDFATDPKHNFVDDRWIERLRALNVPPSPPASDAAFLRRVSLDLTGEQPRTDVIRAFLKDDAPDKRKKLIASLLRSEDFVRFWDIKLGDLLEVTQDRPELGNAAIGYQVWLKRKLAENAPWDEVVRTLLTAVGDPNDRDKGGPVGYALEATGPTVAAEKTAQRFLGLRLRCAQCHDHPFDVWTQDDYFGFAAAFAKVERSAPAMIAMNGRSVVQINPALQVTNPRTKKPSEPRVLGGAPLEASAGSEDPRVAMSAWLTGPENPYFARATANWVWAQLFGRGIVDPVDDLSASNPPVHPEILDALAGHFVEKKFDLRDLIEVVANSAAYQASSSTLPGNAADQRLFSHQIPRPLTAHQMADALALSTGVVNRFRDRSAGTRAIDINDPSTPSTILDVFGRCDRQSSCATGPATSLSLRQSLMVIGGDVIDAKVRNNRGYLASLLSLELEPESIVENLYLRTLCRMPTPDESKHWSDLLGQAEKPNEVAEDLFWALLNTREFAFNH